jgi:hypothetical protein
MALQELADVLTEIFEGQVVKEGLIFKTRLPAPLPISPPSAHLTVKLIIPGVAVEEMVRVRVAEGNALFPFAVKLADEMEPVTPTGKLLVSE